MTTSLEKIEALESKLNAAIAARPATIEALQKRVSDAQATLGAFDAEPFTAEIDRASKAHAAVTAAQALLARLGKSRPWTDARQRFWLQTHHAELCDLLAALIQERSAGREAFRETAALEVGRLSAEIVRLDGSGASDAALETVNAKLAAIENDLARRESSLRAATNAVASFSRATSEIPNAYMSRFEIFKTARDAVTAVSFELSEAVNLEKTQA